MDLRWAQDFLESLINYEKKKIKDEFDFESFKHNLKEFNFIHLKLFNPVLVGGTKGKGSTCHHITAGLIENKIYPGLFTSPHILDVRERIRIGFEKISEQDFVKYTVKIKKKIEKGIKLTYFEALTIIAFLYFYEKKTKFNILEIGLGGRLDSVNSVPSDDAIITPISFDHEHILGNTIEKIAYEKSFIIKGKRVFLAPQVKEAENVILERAKKVGAEVLYLCKKIPLKIIETNEKGTEFKIYFNGNWNFIRTKALGDFQAINAALAFLYLKVKGFKKIDFEKIELEGRFEPIYREPLFIVDGAHNPLSINSVVRNIFKIIKRKPDILIFGTNKDKKISKMLRSLKVLSPGLTVITKAKLPRAEEPEKIKKLAEQMGFKNIKTFEDPQEALKYSFENSNKNSFIVLTGSFYLVEEGKKFIKNMIKFDI